MNLTYHGIVNVNKKILQHFSIDIYDPAFAQHKNAAELWTTNDKKHTPVKVRSKLKIGYAEVVMKGF
jgi:hypothetical protein